MDYVKAGLPLIVIATIVSMIILPSISVLPVKDGNNGCRYNIIKYPSNDCTSAQSLSGTILVIFHM